MNILVTRPEPDASMLAQRLRKMGHGALVDPLMQVVFCRRAQILAKNIQGLIATSRNGLRALQNRDWPNELINYPLFVVGPATAQLAEEMGFLRIYRGTGTALSLIPVIKGKISPDGGQLLHLAGDQLAVDLASELEKEGFGVDAPIVYKMIPADHFSPETVEKLAGGWVTGVILLSPRTTKLFSQLVEQHNLGAVLPKLIVFCLSKAVAQPFENKNNLQLRVAAQPQIDDVLALVNLETAQLS